MRQTVLSSIQMEALMQDFFFSFSFFSSWLCFHAAVSTQTLCHTLLFPLPQMDHDPRNPTYISSQGPLPSTVADFWQVRLVSLSSRGVFRLYRDEELLYVWFCLICCFLNDSSTSICWNHCLWYFDNKGISQIMIDELMYVFIFLVIKRMLLSKADNIGNMHTVNTVQLFTK